jgi:Wax ester synthase/diacylglycerol acyltransferase catalytic domain
MYRTLAEGLRRVKALFEDGGATGSDGDAATAASILRVPVPDLCALWGGDGDSADEHRIIGVVEGRPLTDPDGSVAMSRVRSFIEARLPRARMLLRTLRPTRLGQGTPAWIDAPQFNIAHHVMLAPADRPRSTTRTTSSAGAPVAP